MGNSLWQAKPPAERKVMEMPKSDTEKRVPKTTEKEFGGVIGTLFMTISLPIVSYVLNAMCNEVQL